MMAELSRLNSHLVWLGTHALDIGAMSMFFYCFREREDILRIFEMFSGQRMMTSYIRIGGLALEPPRGWQNAVGNSSTPFPARWMNTKTCWIRIRSGCGRTKGVGYHPARRDAGSGRHRSDDPRRRRAAGTFAKPSRIRATTNSISRSPRAPRTTCTRGIGCGWKRCGRARGSSSRRWKECRKGRGRPTRRSRAARARKDEDADGGAHLPFQDRDRGFPRSGGRSLSGASNRRAARSGITS